MHNLTQTLKDYIYASQLVSPSLCCEAGRVVRTQCVLRFEMVGRRFSGVHVEIAPSSIHSLSVVWCVHSFNSSTLKVEAGGLQIQGHAVLHNEILVLAEYSCMAAEAVLAA